MPSFIIDSPEISIVSLGDAPSELSSATTATGSVAEQIEPKSRQVGKMRTRSRTFQDIALRA